MRWVNVLFSLLLCSPLYALSDTSFSLSDTVEVHKLEDVTDSFQSVYFRKSHSNPVVVCTHNLSSSSEAEATVRLTNVSPSGFDIRVQRPIDRSHDATTVQCMVAEEGKNTLEDGYEFEAHTVLSTNTSGQVPGWDGTGEDVASQLSMDHGSAPAVIGQVMSYNDSYFSTFWTYDCSKRGTPPSSTSICVGKHIGQTSDTQYRHADETLGYIVIEESSGTVRNGTTWTNYRAELGPNTIDGVDTDGNSYDLQNYYTLGTATQNGMNGTNGGWAVLYGSDPFGGTSLDLAIDEDTLGDTERSHVSEEVAYWVFSQDPGLSWMEVQKISNVGSDWVDVSFTNTYTDPVAVCVYNLEDKSNNEAVVRMQNVTTDSMQIKLQRPRERTDVTAGDVYCIVMEEGDHTFDGHKVEAHKVLSDGTNENNDWGSDKMEHPNYSQSYTNPVVLGQVMTYNDSGWSAFWCSNGNVGDPPDSSNLYVGKHIGEEPIKYRANETIGYIIGAAHSGESNHVRYAVARGGDSIYGVGDSSPPYSYDLSGTGYPHYSYAVASQNAEDGGQGGWAVLYGTEPVSTTLDLAIDEETVAGDKSRTHTSEEVSYWVFEPLPVMAISKSSCVIDDPVNDTSNPKRIPGATIRYAIEVNNTGPGAAVDAKAEDNLSQMLDAATITKPKVLAGGCGDCKSLSGGSESGEVNGSTVTIDFGTIDAGSSTTPTQECGYFDVEIK